MPGRVRGLGGEHGRLGVRGVDVQQVGVWIHCSRYDRGLGDPRLPDNAWFLGRRGIYGVVSLGQGARCQDVAIGGGDAGPVSHFHEDDVVAYGPEAVAGFVVEATVYRDEIAVFRGLI